MTDVLAVQGLTKRFGRVQALRGIDLTVEEGEIFGFLGANGAGKTTFTKCVTGFLRPDSGTVHIRGIDALRHRAHALRNVGIVPDEYSLYEDLTGYQNLEYFASLYGFRGDDVFRRVRRAVQTVGMKEKAHKKAKAFSHGMKQRICIAQALLHDPRLIILDEPTNGLDPRGAYELRELMKGLAGEGTSVFLNSHVMSEVEQVCDRVAIVRDGAVIALGTPAEIQKRVGKQQTAVIRLLSLTPPMLAAAKKVAPVRKTGSHQVEVAGTEGDVAQVVAALARANGQVVEVRATGDSLESSFLALTEESA